MTAVTALAVSCPICATPIDLPVTTTLTGHMERVGWGEVEARALLEVDPKPLASHLLDCAQPNLGGDDLLARLTDAADHLASVGHTTGLHDDIRHAITRVRLAELAAHWALGRSDALRPPTAVPDVSAASTPATEETTDG